MLNQTIDSKLLSAQVATSNSIANEEIKTMLAEFGYTEEKLLDGKNLYEETNALHITQKKEYGEQFEATEKLNKTVETAGKEYMKLVKITRVALKEEKASLNKLDLNGKRKESFSGWLEQAETFYSILLGDPVILSKLAEFNITEEKIQNAKTLLEAVKEQNKIQEMEKGDAQQATLNRDKKLDQLMDWMSDFKAIARIALEEKPQLLEKLGILEKS